MTTWLVILVIGLLLVAVGIQVYYLRGLSKSGLEVNRSTRIVSYFNIALLLALAVGLAAFAIVKAG